jgi:hypothetical protein
MLPAFDQRRAVRSIPELEDRIFDCAIVPVRRDDIASHDDTHDMIAWGSEFHFRADPVTRRALRLPGLATSSAFPCPDERNRSAGYWSQAGDQLPLGRDPAPAVVNVTAVTAVTRTATRLAAVSAGRKRAGTSGSGDVGFRVILTEPPCHGWLLLHPLWVLTGDATTWRRNSRRVNEGPADCRRRAGPIVVPARGIYGAFTGHRR